MGTAALGSLIIAVLKVINIKNASSTDSKQAARKWA